MSRCVINGAKQNKSPAEAVSVGEHSVVDISFVAVCGLFSVIEFSKVNVVIVCPTL